MTMLLILLPVTFICGAIQMHVLSFTRCFVVNPVPFIYIAISMYQSTHSVSHVIEPVSIIAAAIDPNLCTSSLSDISHRVPLTLILCTILKCGKLHEFPHHLLALWIILVILKRVQILKDLVHYWILELFTLL